MPPGPPRMPLLWVVIGGMLYGGGCFRRVQHGIDLPAKTGRSTGHQVPPCKNLREIAGFTGLRAECLPA